MGERAKNTARRGKRWKRWSSSVMAVLAAAGIGGVAAVRAEGETARAADSVKASAAQAERAALSLGEAWEAGDELMAYHFAATASENAARAGDIRASSAFGALAERVRRYGLLGSPVKETVEAYLSGTLPESPDTDSPTASRPTPEYVLPAGSAERAETAARQMIGENAPLIRDARSGGDRMVFSGANGYVIMDRRTGEPVEFGISLAPGENRMGAEECAAAAEQFLRRYCPATVGGEGEIRFRVTFPEDGFAEVGARLSAGEVLLCVKRETGRIVGFCRRQAPSRAAWARPGQSPGEISIVPAERARARSATAHWRALHVRGGVKGLRPFLETALCARYFLLIAR